MISWVLGAHPAKVANAAMKSSGAANRNLGRHTFTIGLQGLIDVTIATVRFRMKEACVSNIGAWSCGRRKRSGAPLGSSLEPSAGVAPCNLRRIPRCRCPPRGARIASAAAPVIAAAASHTARSCLQRGRYIHERPVRHVHGSILPPGLPRGPSGLLAVILVSAFLGRSCVQDRCACVPEGCRVSSLQSQASRTRRTPGEALVARLPGQKACETDKTCIDIQEPGVETPPDSVPRGLGGTTYRLSTVESSLQSQRQGQEL